MSSASDDASAEAAAVGKEGADTFLAWASRHRRRAAHDGAWKVEVSERVLRCGARLRTISSWHNAQEPASPLRRARRQRGTAASDKQQPSSRHATKARQLDPKKPTSKQQRSAKRSAAHHSAARLRALRRVLRVVLFVVRLRRVHTASIVLCDAPTDSPSKRRRATELLGDACASTMSMCAEVHNVLNCSPPEPKRAAPSAPPSAGLRQGLLLG